MDSLQTALAADIQKIRIKSPLILNVTNYVAMDLTANALLALGASPIMAHEEEELEELVRISDAIVINSGTLDKSFIVRAKVTLKAAKTFKKPVVFDPVGAGATRLRSDFAKSLTRDESVTVIRGNVSEVVSLLDETVTTKGVDSTIVTDSWIEKVRNESKRTQVVLAISGETDYIFHRGKLESLRRGDPLMTKVTAMGCTASSLTGAFLSVNPSASQAALHAMAVMGIAGEIAKVNSKGPGSFRAAFLDAVWGLK